MIGRTGALGRRALTGAVVAVALVAVMGGPAGALAPLPITCTAAGTVTFTDSVGVDAWSVAGRGSCQGDMTGTYFLDFAGTGTSDMMGLCDGASRGPVRDLNIVITGTLTNAATGEVRAMAEEWFSQLTTYPVATPFLIATDDGKVGAGAFFNHIFNNCTGSPVAQFTFTQLS